MSALCQQPREQNEVVKSYPTKISPSLIEFILIKVCQNKPETNLKIVMRVFST